MSRAPHPREHGTSRGYNQHRTAGEDACQSCKAALAADRQAKRAGGDRTRHRLYMAARGRALRRLGAAHLEEAEALLVEELTRLGRDGYVPRRELRREATP